MRDFEQFLESISFNFLLLPLNSDLALLKMMTNIPDEDDGEQARPTSNKNGRFLTLTHGTFPEFHLENTRFQV